MMDVRQLYIYFAPFVDKYVFVDAALSTLILSTPFSLFNMLYFV
jgi:hypothetical protein